MIRFSFSLFLFLYLAPFPAAYGKPERPTSKEVAKVAVFYLNEESKGAVLLESKFCGDIKIDKKVDLCIDELKEIPVNTRFHLWLRLLTPRDRRTQVLAQYNLLGMTRATSQIVSWGRLGDVVSRKLKPRFPGKWAIELFFEDGSNLTSVAKIPLTVVDAPNSTSRKVERKSADTVVAAAPVSKKKKAQGASAQKEAGKVAPVSKKKTEKRVKGKKGSKSAPEKPPVLKSDKQKIAYLKRLHRRAIRHFKKKKTAKAVETLNIFFDEHNYRNVDPHYLDIQYIEVMNDYGYLLKEAGKVEESIPILKHVLIRDKTRKIAYLNLADAQIQVPGQTDNAISNYKLYFDLMYQAGLSHRVPSRVTGILNLDKKPKFDRDGPF